MCVYVEIMWTLGTSNIMAILASRFNISNSLISKNLNQIFATEFDRTVVHRQFGPEQIFVLQMSITSLTVSPVSSCTSVMSPPAIVSLIRSTPRL